MVCRTDFQPQAIFKYVALCGVGLFALLGARSLTMTSDAPVNLTAKRFTETTANRKDDKNIVSENINKPTSANAVSRDPAENQTQKPSEQRENKTAETVKVSESDPTYFCGAATKKGSPCSRRVKGGGRCWQHAGQPAVLSSEKLLVSR